MAQSLQRERFGPARFGRPLAGPLGLAALLGLACSSGNQSSTTGTGGAAPDAGSASGGTSGAATGGAPATSSGGNSGSASGGSGGSGGTSGGASGGALGSGGGGGAAAPTCVPTPVPRRSQGTVVELAVEPMFGDAPFVFGEANALPDGTQVVPLNFRFYVSSVELTTSGGNAVPVDIVDASGTPVTYGIHLYNAEDDTSHAFRVLAPPGDYTGARFVLGIGGDCDAGFPTGRLPPLDDSSQLSWPHGFGYLFLRYEGRAEGAGAAQIPGAIHMGGDITHLDMPGAPVIPLEGALAVPASGTLRKSIRVYLDQIFKGAVTSADLNPYFMTAMPEVQNGERLRLNAPGLKLFGFAP